MQEVEIKHLKAALILAEERNFSRAAYRLRIGQSGLTKQVHALEDFLGHKLFLREGRTVSLTPQGEIFVGEARACLQHLNRAIHLSRASAENAELVLHIGKSPYTDPYLITKLLSLHFPLHPHSRIELTSKLGPELINELISGSLDLAFLTDVPENSKVSGVVVADQRFFVAMLRSDPLAQRLEISADDLSKTSCIMFERHVQPYLYDELILRARPATTNGAALHHVMTAEDALQMILRGLGVAILTQSGAWRIQRSNVTIRPLSTVLPHIKTRLAARADNDSPFVSDVVRSLMRALTPGTVNHQLQLDLV